MTGWELPFDESMLEPDAKLIIHCPDKLSAIDLFQIFRGHRLKFVGDPTLEDTHWNEYKEEMCYRVSGEQLIIGRRTTYDIDRYQRYVDYVRCTFYMEEFDCATDKELLDFVTGGDG